MYTATFKTMSDKRKETVREQIESMWSQGKNATEISKKVRLSTRSVATTLGNLTRQCQAKAKHK